MTTTKAVIIAASVGFIIGAIVSGVSVGLIMKKMCKPTPCSDTIINDKPVVVVKPISGPKGTITHSNFNFKNKQSVCFTTTSTGKAKIETSINKNLIPEAHKWMTYKHAIQLSYSGLIYSDGYYRHIFGADYFHRFGWFAIGCGPRLTYYETAERKVWGGGFSIAAQAWFKGI